MTPYNTHIELCASGRVEFSQPHAIIDIQVLMKS